MPKLKTHKGAKKRIHVTATGKLLRTKGHKSHLRRTKPKATKRLYDNKLPVHKADVERIASLLPGVSH
ncbi:MAG: 50S ribosomal protein L35 [Dehalococcoidia bacterium]|nr:50S ribosomal protein L35 [Dehalococcoidia bacterium]